MINKVLHIINSPGQGGAETMVKDIAMHFTTHLVFCLRFDPKDRFAVLGNRVSYGTSGANHKYNPIVFYKIVKLIRREKIKIIHTHLANSLLYGIFLKMIFPALRHIYHEHGEVIYGNKNLHRILHLLGNKIDLTLAVSEVCKNEFLIHSSKNDVKVLKNYVEVSLFKDISRKIATEPVIGFAGRLVYLKGVDVLINAVSVSKESWNVLIYGDGHERKEYEKLARILHVDDRVKFIGYQSDRKKIYESINIFVSPSRNESASLTNLEARAAGCVVVTTRVGGIPEYIDDMETGVIIESENHIELANKIDLLYRDVSLCNEIARKSKDRIIEFDMPVYMDKLARIYNDLK